MTNKLKSNRGFGAMDPKKQRAIASAGGKAAHRSGHAHEWDRKEARAAGLKGGGSPHRRRGPKPASDTPEDPPT